MIVLTEIHVNSSNPGLDMTVVGIHCHESGVKKSLSIADGIHWGHEGVPVPIPSEDAYLGGLIEMLSNGRS